MNEPERDTALLEALRPAEGREIELKLDVPAGDLAVLKQHPLLRALARGRPLVRRLRTIYYDTPDRDLAGERLALRVRQSGRGYVQALKGEGSAFGGLFVRGEWEARLPGAEPDLERVPSLAARSLARRVSGGKPLEPVFETEFVRTRHRLQRGDTELFLDFDEGEIRARGRSSPIREIELELVRGDPGVLHGLALELHETLPLRPSATSKAQRGYALAAGTSQAPQRAPDIALPAAASVEAALAVVLAACLGQVLANLEPARDGSDPEGVHQLRVGLRRTRAALALFRDVLPEEQSRSFRDEIRWLAGELGPARDLDVFLAGILEPLSERFAGDPSLKRLRDAARELREAAYVRARAAIDAPRCAALCLALGGWLTARAWRSEANEETCAALAEPARERGAALLERRFRKARKLGRGLARRTDPERHRLRIELKKLRYGGEFLGSLYAEGPVRRSLEQLSELQDTLGALNDVAMAERWLHAIEEHLGPEWNAGHERAAGFVTGWTSHESVRRLARLARRWKSFGRAKPFWRA
jgi:inorganic triphosphatase YgiF